MVDDAGSHPSGPVARPKLALPTVPLTPKFVRLKALNALAESLQTHFAAVTFRPDRQLFSGIEMLSPESQAVDEIGCCIAH